jgi:hypothetical protein
VPEYLIRAAGPSSWPAIPKSRLPEVLGPRGYGCEEASGPGDLRLRLGSCEMAFSAEDVGWQVCFEGDTTGQDTDAVVSQVAQQVGEFTGASAEWVRYD